MRIVVFSLLPLILATVAAAQAAQPDDAPVTPLAPDVHTDPATETAPVTEDEELPPASSQPQAPRRPPVGLLTPIPEEGGLPPIYSKLYELTVEQIQHRAAVRQYGKQIRKIRHDYLGPIKVPSIRQEGLTLLCEFTDPAAFKPLIDELKREKDDVKLALMDHFALQKDEGQAALAWMAIYDSDAAIQNEALKRMVSPVSEPVRYILNNALRSHQHEVVSSAASLAGALNVIETIPLLIFGQAAVTSASDNEGDLAWIAIQTQRAYVQGLVPVVGDQAGAFQPIVGIVSEGVVMRVVDAVVIVYRTPVHASLVNMTTNDWGQPTNHLGYNIKAWWEWYNTQYIPFKRAQARETELAGETPLK